MPLAWPFRRDAASAAVTRIAPLSGRIFETTYRVLTGVFRDGFIHAGNLAYLAILALFPFFIVAAAVTRLLGRTDDGLRSVTAFLQTVPPNVADVLAKPIEDVLVARSGNLLWLGALVGLWTTASFIETIRDVVRRAYGYKSKRPFWEYRLGSMGIIVGAVLTMMLAFTAQVALVGIEQFIRRLLPFAAATAQIVQLTRILPGAILFGALWVLFWALTPRAYKKRGEARVWPGALLTAVCWLATTSVLPLVLTNFSNYNLTYGSLAGVMISLIFFFLIGLGVIVGAHLNAALANAPHPALQDPDVQSKEAGGA